MAKRIDAPVGAIEQLWILWTGFHDGVDYAGRHPLMNPYLDADLVVITAAKACERKRHAKSPLGGAVVHSAYTYGWMAGYLAAQRGLANASDKLPPNDATGVTDSPQITR